MDIGGFLVPGPDSVDQPLPGMEETGDEPAAEGEQTPRPAAGPRQGSRRSQAEAAAARSPGHSVQPLAGVAKGWRGNGITECEFEELDYWYPDVRVVASSSRCTYLTLGVGLFRDWDVSARLVLELPHPSVAWRARPVVTMSKRAEPIKPGSIRWHPPSYLLKRESMVPPVRAWAWWHGGIAHGSLIVSHHRQPDFSICACLPHQWIRGVHPLVDYVGMCTSWVGKTLHEIEMGFYPGLQHYPEWTRVERDRGNEYCGCGLPRRYGDCCRQADLQLSKKQLDRARRDSQGVYFDDLIQERRRGTPPTGFLCL